MSEHEELFARYLASLKQAKQEVDAWWAALLAREEQLTGDADQAKLQVMRRWPAGPGAHPRIVGIVRKTYLECLALNERHEDEGGEEVLPHILMTEWLLDGQNDDLVVFLARLSYWPIGFDEDFDEC